MPSITIVSDAPNCGITYNCHSDYSRGVIYDHNVFIVQANEFAANIKLKKFYEIGHRSSEPFFHQLTSVKILVKQKFNFSKQFHLNNVFRRFQNNDHCGYLKTSR